MVSVVATSLVTTPMAKKRTPASCSGSCMSSNHLNVNFPDPAPRSASTMGALSHNTFSTLMTSLVDFFHAENCPVTLIDCDTENKVHGSFSHFFKEPLKVDITTPSGFDVTTTTFSPHRH